MDVLTKKHGNGGRERKTWKTSGPRTRWRGRGDVYSDLRVHFSWRGVAAAPQQEKVPTNMSGENAVPRAESGRH